MKEYWKSDYALNKRSTSIVYQFATELVKITLEDYIRENPGKTAEDFLALKAISDQIYQEQFSRTKAQTRRELPLYNCVEVSVPSAEDDLLSKARVRELELIHARLERFLEIGPLTEIQRRRFTLYCIRNLSTRQIAAAEHVRQFAIWKSLQLCQKKFQKFLDKQGGHPPF